MYEWTKVEEKFLVRFVNKKVIELLPKLPENPFDLVQKKKDRRKLIEMIYECLVAKKIRYSYEDYHPNTTKQLIRSPSQILSSPGLGTCLDLALLFCGLCLGYDLLPMLIIIDGHALAAVSLNHNCQNDGWNNPGRRELQLFRKENGEPDLLTGEEKLQELQQLIDDEAYIAIECTGLAHTDSFVNSEEPEAKGRKNGFLDFNRALDAGSEQLSNPRRSFQFAIDIALAHYGWGIEPLPLEILNSPTELTRVQVEQKVRKFTNGEMIGVESTGEPTKGNLNIEVSQGADTFENGKMKGVVMSSNN
ncbi:hypothetical protein [Scytonema sp. PRP1]|uniref:hypothetical protein n=1 Tax=Scytonema sp. PRP1 TaxID=3120513 RepID=UPI00300C3319